MRAFKIGLCWFELEILPTGSDIWTYPLFGGTV